MIEENLIKQERKNPARSSTCTWQQRSQSSVCSNDLKQCQGTLWVGTRPQPPTPGGLVPPSLAQVLIKDNQLSPKQPPNPASELAQIRDCSQQAVWMWPPCFGGWEFNSMDMAAPPPAAKQPQARPVQQYRHSFSPTVLEPSSQTNRSHHVLQEVYSQEKCLFHTLLGFGVESPLRCAVFLLG